MFMKYRILLHTLNHVKKMNKYLFVFVAAVVGEAKRPFLTNLALVNVNLVGDSDKKKGRIIIDKHCGKIKIKKKKYLPVVPRLVVAVEVVVATTLWG